MSFGVGLGIGQRARENEQQYALQLAQDQRAAQLHASQMQDAGRRQKLAAEFDTSIDAAEPAGVGTTPMSAYGLQVPVEDTPELAQQRGLRGAAKAESKAKGTTDPMNAYNDKIRRLEFARDQLAAQRAFDRMSTENPQQLEEMIAKVSADTKVRGAGKFVMGKDPKTGKDTRLFEYRPDDSSSVSLLPQELKEVLTYKFLESRYPAEAKDYISKLTANAQKVVGDMAKQTHDNVQVHNQTVLGQERNAIDRMQAGTAAAREARESQQIVAPQFGYQVGADGRPMPSVSGLQFNKMTGKYAPVMQQLSSEGFLPAGALDPAHVSKSAEPLVGTPTGRLDSNNKPILHTPQSAYAATYQQILDSVSKPRSVTSGLTGIDKMFGGSQVPETQKTAPTQGIPTPTQPFAPANLGYNVPQQRVAPPVETKQGPSVMERAMLNYLNGKLERNEQLTPAEQYRAAQYGLIR